MSSIIRWLHGGEKYPSEIFDFSKAYQNLIENFAYQKDAFLNDLTPRQIEEFEKILNKSTAVASYETTDAFRVGFCIGARIMMEVTQFEEQ